MYSVCDKDNRARNFTTDILLLHRAEITTNKLFEGVRSVTLSYSVLSLAVLGGICLEYNFGIRVSRASVAVRLFVVVQKTLQLHLFVFFYNW